MSSDYHLAIADAFLAGDSQSVNTDNARGDDGLQRRRTQRLYLAQRVDDFHADRFRHIANTTDGEMFATVHGIRIDNFVILALICQETKHQR